MPTSSSCFSNPADLPPVTGHRNAAQSAQSGWLNCFSYPADVPPGPRRMHTGSSCFKYPGDVPPGTRTRNAAQSPSPATHLLQLFQLTSRRVTVSSLICATRSRCQLCAFRY